MDKPQIALESQKTDKVLRQVGSVKKQEQLEELLVSLSSDMVSEEDLPNLQRQLMELYSDGWRHYYSDIYTVLYGLFEKRPESLVTLSENMQTLETCLEWECAEIQLKWQKLYDHVSLDVARFQHYASLQGYTAEMNARLTSQESRLTAVDTELRTTQTHYITILGIFAAIVLTLAGSISFTNAAFSNLMTASPLRLFAACGIQLLLIVNVTYCLTASILPEKLPVKQNLQNWIRWFNITLIVGGCAALTLYLLLNAPEPETNCPILNFFL